MLKATVYHLNLNHDTLNRIKRMSSEKVVQSQVKSVMKEIKELAVGIEIELKKEEQTNE